MEYIHYHPSPLGEILLASDGTTITGLWFKGSRYYGETLEKETQQSDGLPVFQQTDRWLDLYFAGEEPDFRPPVLVRGSDFRKSVCRIMMTIPYGRTCTYGEIARQIAEERKGAMSARAVGGAVGHNPVSILVPCHRVIGNDGSLTGYGGGIWRKIKLLELEGHVLTDDRKGIIPGSKLKI